MQTNSTAAHLQSIKQSLLLTFDFVEVINFNFKIKTTKRTSTATSSAIRLSTRILFSNHGNPHKETRPGSPHPLLLLSSIGQGLLLPPIGTIGHGTRGGIPARRGVPSRISLAARGRFLRGRRGPRFGGVLADDQPRGDFRRQQCQRSL